MPQITSILSHTTLPTNYNRKHMIISINSLWNPCLAHSFKTTVLLSYSVGKHCFANSAEIFFTYLNPVHLQHLCPQHILLSKYKANKDPLAVFCNCTHLSWKVGILEGHRKYCLNRSSNACPMVLMTSWARPSRHSSTWQAKRKRFDTCTCKSLFTLWWDALTYDKTPTCQA